MESYPHQIDGCKILGSWNLPRHLREGKEYRTWYDVRALARAPTEANAWPTRSTLALAVRARTCWPKGAMAPSRHWQANKSIMMGTGSGNLDSQVSVPRVPQNSHQTRQVVYPALMSRGEIPWSTSWDKTWRSRRRASWAAPSTFTMWLAVDNGRQSV